MNLTDIFGGQKFIEHLIAEHDTQPIRAIKFEYRLAGNGLFIRAKRNEFSVCLPLFKLSVKGLQGIKTEIIRHKPRIQPDTPANNSLQRFSLDVRNDLGKDFAVSFVDSKDVVLTNAPRPRLPLTGLAPIVGIHQIRLHPKKVIAEANREPGDDEFSNRFD